MRFSLLWKLSGTISLLVACFALSLAFLFQWNTSANFTALVSQNDDAKARRLAPFVEQVFEQGGWLGVQDWLAASASSHSMMGMMDHRQGTMVMTANQALLMGARVVATSVNETVVADSEGTFVGRSLKRQGVAAKGIELVASGTPFGHLLVGTMIAPTFSSSEQQFVDSLRFTLLVSSAAALFVSLLAGFVLFRRIVSPLRRIAEASSQISHGDFDCRVPVKSRDELGEISGQFNAMAAALKGSRTRQRQFISNAAHELRTPISLMQSTLEMMVSGLYPADTNRLNQLHTETIRLGNLVSDMQVLARADDNRLALNWTALNLRTLLEEPVNRFRSAADRKNIHLVAEVSNDQSTVQLDHEKMLRVLTNLLENGLRHAPTGSTIRIGGSIRPDSQECSIFVQDEGPGIAATEAQRVFERFYRVDIARNREQGGSGLGLAICKEIVEAHGGRIELDSSYLSGARFLITLPAQL